MSNLRNKDLESRNEEDRQIYAKQRNLCVSLLIKARSSYYSTLNKQTKKKKQTNKLIDNRKFCKTVKPVLSNKLVSSEKIASVENEKIITDSKEIPKVLTGFFSNLVKSLNVPSSKS